MRSASGVTDLHSNHLGSAVARQSQTGQGLNVNDFQQYSAGVVEGMGSLGAGVANAVKGETLQTAARGLEVLISDPGGAVATVGQAALDQGKALMQTAAAVASDPAGAAAQLNDNPRALGRMLGQAAGDLAVAKIVKDARGGGEGGGAQCALNSFAPDTPVLTADGAQAIGTLNVGDVVLAYDTASGTVSRVPITHVWVHRDAMLVDLRIDGTLIETTTEHPFFTAETGWVDAGALWAGAHIRTVAGTAGVVQQIAVVARTQVLYNLTVATANTFFVGRAGWLVHNDTCHVSRRQAFQEAKDANDVPRSQAGLQTKIPDKNTQQPLRQGEFTNNKGVQITIREDLPRTYPDGGYQGPHFNAGPTLDRKLKQHYYYEAGE